LLEADTVHLMLPDGSKLYVYTIIDLFSRWAYAEVVERISARQSVAFVRHAHRAAPFRFLMVQTDNGPEFQKMFKFSLARDGIAHRHSRVRQSNDQAHIERFNRTIQEECLDHTTHTLKNLRKALKAYLPYYNGERLHMGINYQTPLEVLQRC
jgi:transposase InsO family protein